MATWFSKKSSLSRSARLPIWHAESNQRRANRASSFYLTVVDKHFKAFRFTASAQRSAIYKKPETFNGRNKSTCLRKSYSLHIRLLDSRNKKKQRKKGERGPYLLLVHLGCLVSSFLALQVLHPSQLGSPARLLRTSLTLMKGVTKTKPASVNLSPSVTSRSTTFRHDFPSSKTCPDLSFRLKNSY